MSLDTKNWGRVTPEFINQSENRALLVFNHEIKDEHFLKLNTIFIKARVKAYQKQLPSNMSMEVIFDDTQGSIEQKYKERLSKKISETIPFNYLSTLQ